MKTFRLHGENRFINPLWLNRVAGRSFILVVGEKANITIEGVIYHFGSSDQPPPPGTEIKVWLDHTGFFVCMTLVDIQERDRLKENQRNADEQSHREKLTSLRKEAYAFNSSIRFPVKWDIGRKHVLSGLSENSWGDGNNKATVNHILLLEDMAIGRLKRKRGDFLCCASDRGSFNSLSDYQDEGIRVSDGEGVLYQPSVTCKACLKLLSRFSLNDSLR